MRPTIRHSHPRRMTLLIWPIFIFTPILKIDLHKGLPDNPGINDPFRT
jgi:hypothetical protein